MKTLTIDQIASLKKNYLLADRVALELDRLDHLGRHETGKALFVLKGSEAFFTDAILASLEYKEKSEARAEWSQYNAFCAHYRGLLNNKLSKDWLEVTGSLAQSFSAFEYADDIEGKMGDDLAKAVLDASYISEKIVERIIRLAYWDWMIKKLPASTYVAPI